MGEIQLAKITLWLLGIPVTGWAFWENLYQPGTWKADVLFIVALIILVARGIYLIVKWWQDILMRRQQLKSRGIDLAKKEFENDEFIHDKNEK